MTLNKYFKDIIFLASNINNLMINVMLIYPDIYIYIYIYILKKKDHLDLLRFQDRK
jgi:hypothetical protein